MPYGCFLPPLLEFMIKNHTSALSQRNNSFLLSETVENNQKISSKRRI